MTPTPFFRWYDCWIGVYVDVNMGKRAIYVCPIPMFGINIAWTRSGGPGLKAELAAAPSHEMAGRSADNTPPLSASHS